MPLHKPLPSLQRAGRGCEPRQQQRWEEFSSRDAACPQLPSPTGLCLSPAQRWGRMGAVEASAVGLGMAGRRIICHLLSVKVWPPLGDPALV